MPSPQFKGEVIGNDIIMAGKLNCIVSHRCTEDIRRISTSSSKRVDRERTVPTGTVSGEDDCRGAFSFHIVFMADQEKKT